jgi:methylmalonyl-CoA mutase
MTKSKNRELESPRRSSFAPVTRQHWEEKLTRDLKGISAADLSWTDVAGIKIDALYDQDRTELVAGLGDLAPSWQVCVLVEDPDPKKALQSALDAGAGGAEAITLRLARSGRERGVVFPDPAGLNVFCDAVNEAGLEIHLDGPLTVLEMKGALDKVSSAGMDPLRALAQGCSESDYENLRKLALDSVEAAVNGQSGTPLTVDSSFYHGAGASHALELGLSLASCVQIVREAHGRGLAPADVTRLTTLRMAVGTDFFGSIAKLRAARLCWNRLCEVFDVDSRCVLHALPSELHETARGRWVNTLRNTAYCFAAAVAGADRMTLLSHEHAVGVGDELGHRIARNTQLVLRLESGLDQVKDPAAGSYYLEELTEELARKGWAFFQAIEGQGGMRRALASGWVTQEIGANRERRTADVHSKESPILGVSLFPDPSEEQMSPPAQPETPANVVRARPLSFDVKGAGP